MNLSFAGCGFLGIYHVGVAACFKKYAPHLLLDKISGASAGAIAACSLLCDLPLGDMLSDVLRVVGEARQRTLGPFSPSFNIHNILVEGLQKSLPEDAHLRVNGKLHISLTRVYDGKNVIVSQFSSKEDLVQALLASAFIPVFSGLLPPKFHGIRYMDGGFSDNLPMLDENTITVSPFCGESDICPRDLSSQLFHINVSNTSIELSRHNIYRFMRILFPPKPEVLSNMCKQGFDDALMFLHRNNLINCTRCLAVQSTYVISETMDESLEFDPECQECKLHRQESLASNIPDTILTVFEEAIESANKGIVNWVFKHRGMKLLSVLSLPYTLPADIVYATFTKFLANAPSMGSNLKALSQYIMDQLCEFVKKLKKTQQINTTVTCQLAITEFGGTKYDIDNMKDAPVTKVNKMNINFTLNLDESADKPDGVCSRKISPVLSRHPSLVLNAADVGTQLEDDTFENILKETAHQDTIMAFYYTDENNKVKVTEIVDVTDVDSSVMLSPEERENNTHLQFDDEWNPHNLASSWVKHTEDDPYYGGDELEMSDDDHGDSRMIFSDPESEWSSPENTRRLSVDKMMAPNSLPESDQRSVGKLKDRPLSRKPSYVIMSDEL